MTTAVTLPADKFDKTLTFVRPATPPARVPLDNLAVLPGFNTRVKDAEYKERVASITDSIVQNGFFDDKPFAVTMLPNDSTVYIYDGEHRFDATKAAVLDGSEFPDGLPVSFAKDGATVRDLTIHLARGNEGAALNMVESAAVVRRLLDIGLNKDEIAKALTRSPRHIENLITLAGANQSVKKAVAEGKIAGAEAVKMVRKHGAKDGAAKVAEVVKAAEEKGAKKATPKTMAAPAGPKMKKISFDVSLATGTAQSDVIAAIASKLGEQLPTNDDEVLTEDGRLTFFLYVIDHDAEAAAKAAAEERAEKAAKREAERAENAKKREAEKAERQAKKDAEAAAKLAAKPAAETKTPKQTKGKTVEGAKTPGETKARRTARKPKEAPPAAEGAPAADDGMGGL